MHPNQRVKELRKAGRLVEALKLGHELLADHADDRYLRSDVGWVLHDQMKGEVQQARSGNGGPSPSQLTEFLRSKLKEYAKLDLERPDLLFSRLVFWAFLAPGDHKFLGRFLMWAGHDAFQDEDFRSNPSNDGGVYEPLIEKAARKASKLARDEDDLELHEFLIEFIDQVLSRADVQAPQWLQYNKALLLHRVGRTSDSEALLIPVVRAKRNEFWAWHALAKVREQSNPESCLTIYAKACLCCQNSKYGVGVYEDLARSALTQGEFSLAKWAAGQSAEGRNAEGWRFPQSLRDLLEADWYETASVPPNPQEVLEQFAEASSAEIYADCPWLSGNYLGTFVAKSGKEHDKIAVRHQEKPVEVVWPTRGSSLSENHEFGGPISAKVFEEQDRLAVVDISTREGGEDFDCLNHAVGVIDHQNTEKKLASVYLTDTQFCLIRYSECSWVTSLPPGAAVEIFYTINADRISMHYARTAEFVETSSIRRVSGGISINPRGFGFVDKVFVPPPIAQGYEDGDEVSFIAVKKPNRKTNQLGWTALGSGNADIVDLGRYRQQR